MVSFKDLYELYINLYVNVIALRFEGL